MKSLRMFSVGRICNKSLLAFASVTPLDSLHPSFNLNHAKIDFPDMSGPTTIHLQRCLIALENRDPEARAELLGFAQRRLRLLAQRMFHRFPKLYWHEQSDDLFQEAML